MKERRRTQPMLETLDERIVPSTVAIGSARHALVAEHASPHGLVDAAKLHHPATAKIVHHARMHHRLHHNKIGPSVPVNYVLTPANTAVPNGPAASTKRAATTPIVASLPTPVVATSVQPKVAATSATAPSTPTDTVVVNAPIVTPVTTGSGSDINDAQNGPLAKAGVDLFTIYQEFQKQAGSDTFSSSLAGLVKIEGTNVGISARMSSGNFDSFVSALSGLGMQIQATDASHGIVEGFLPINQLLAAAENQQTLALTAMYVPRKFTMAG